jgi:hypothetical protein
MVILGTLDPKIQVQRSAVSLSSKLAAILGPDGPLWDRYVHPAAIRPFVQIFRLTVILPEEIQGSLELVPEKKNRCFVRRYQMDRRYS